MGYVRVRLCTRNLANEVEDELIWEKKYFSNQTVLYTLVYSTYVFAEALIIRPIRGRTSTSYDYVNIDLSHTVKLDGGGGVFPSEACRSSSNIRTRI